VNHKHIFIAEDDPASRELLTEALQLWGYEVRAFPNGAELLAAWDAAEPDLFILDIQMPILDGIATVGRLRQSNRPLAPILALTAFAMTTDRERVLNAGFDGYLTKPISLQGLRETIENFVMRKTEG
jgi:CheY-like chemotaxis protein